MLARLFPEQFDNRFGGRFAASLLLVPILIVKTGIGANSLLNPRFVAETVDGIPVSAFTSGGAEAVIAFFAVWGLAQLILALQGWIVLVRYRSMIPLVYLLLLIEQLGRSLIFIAHPIMPAVSAPAESVRASPVTINLIISGALLLGLILSVQRRRRLPIADDGAGD